jgi:hypothetical protein
LAGRLAGLTRETSAHVYFGGLTGLLVLMAAPFLNWFRVHSVFDGALSCHMPPGSTSAASEQKLAKKLVDALGDFWFKARRTGTVKGTRKQLATNGG